MMFILIHSLGPDEYLGPDGQSEDEKSFTELYPALPSPHESDVPLYRYLDIWVNDGMERG